MEIEFGILIICALISAFICGFLFMREVALDLQRSRIAVNAGMKSEITPFDYVLSLSTSLFSSLATKLLEIRFVKDFVRRATFLISAKGKSVQQEQVASFCCLVILALAVLAFAISGSVLFVICAVASAVVISNAVINKKIAEISSSMRDQVPDALRTMSSCARTGLSLMQTLEETSAECTGALENVLLVASRRMRLGSSVPEALATLNELKEVPELKFVAVAFDVQHTSGGAISPLLDAARESVLSEIELARTLRVQTAQAKMSAAIVTCMPFLLLALFSFASPGFLDPFFTSVAGFAILLVALGMQAAGIFLVRKILKRAED